MQPEIRLRPSTPADVAFVRELENDGSYRPYIGRWSREEHEAAIANPAIRHWIVEPLGEARRMGFAIAFDWRALGHGVYLKRIAIAEPEKGYGRAALRALAHVVFEELSSDRLWLTVRANNERAAALYRSFGFEAVAERAPSGSAIMALWAKAYRSR